MPQNKIVYASQGNGQIMWSKYPRIRLFIANARTVLLVFKMQVLLLFRHVRPTDQETTVNEKRACYSHFPRGRACHAMQRQKEVPEEVLKQKELGEKMSRSFIVVSVGKARQGKQAQDWLVLIMSVGSRYRGHLQLSNSWPGTIKAEEYCLLKCKSQIESMVWRTGLD